MSTPRRSPAAAPAGAPVGVPAADPAAAEARGLGLGLLGVAIFALTLPMTRLAVGPAEAPQLPPAFVTAGRAALAGLLSLCWLAARRAPRPPPALRPALAVCAAGTVLGFPLALALALREVDAVHAAVVTGLLPLATAALAARVFRQRPSAGFWACALLGCALVVGYAALHSTQGLRAADGWLLLAVASAAVGYVAGAKATPVLGAERTICWVLVGSLPLTLPAAIWLWPAQPATAAAWAAFGYVGLFSMWLGFFAWYRALAVGGAVRVSQVQLLQPFLALISAAVLLGEPLPADAIGFALAVAATVWLGRRAAVDRARTR
jgi:drug/metabolite transporter (DMT)-like permease